MKSANIHGNSGNDILSITLLNSESVDSLLNSFFQRTLGIAEEDKKQKIIAYINFFKEAVKNVSPNDIENNNINDLVSKLKEFEILLESDQLLQDYFNTLNLCIVGLGNKVKQYA